ncbi:MAG: histidine kinase [Burkholderiaceae bacterium]|nr:histidine kinase [Burkholderiaceae bacterium]
MNEPGSSQAGAANAADGSPKDAAPKDAAPKDAARSRLAQAGDVLSRAASGAATRAGVFAPRFGNWLVSIGWGKFFLLAVLLLALAGMAGSLFPSPHRSRRAPPHVPVDVHISVDTDGLHISPPPGESDVPEVNIDEKGVRIQGKNGSGNVVIDDNGVRIEKAPPKTADKNKTSKPSTADKTSKSSAAGGAGKAAGEASPTVTLPPGVLSDPDKVSEAVEAAKDQIEEIVKDQVNSKIRVMPPPETSWPNLVELVLMLMFALMIVKIALGSKRRAESRALAADAVAADEGLKRQLAEAQLKTMQAQVEPHFLFNTLASVDYLIETDPPRAARMQKNLIQYLRTALPQMRQASSTLAQELALCRSYLELLKMRMDERLQFAISMPTGLSTAAFPPMMLQTLVENSIKHGLEPKPEGGALTLNADVADGNLRVAVSDTGLGFGVAGASGSGLGLANVRERLQALFGARGRLTIESNSPSGTIATIVIPYSVGAAGAAA